MSFVTKKSEKDIAINAIAEFLLPLQKLVFFVKYISSSELRNKELVEKISKIEVAVEKERVEYRRFFSAWEKLEKTIYSQEEKLASIDRELADTRQYINRLNLYSKAFEDKSQSMESHIGKLVNKTYELKTRELIHGGTLTNAAAEIGLANIEFLLKGIEKNEKSKPYIFGLNKGGMFLATYLAHRMDLHEKYIVKCDYRPDFDKVVFCENREIDGPIVIIDDVTRTGATMRRMKDYVREKYPSCSVFSVVLVTARSRHNLTNEDYEIVDYSPWFTQQSSVTLPWSKSSEDDVIESDKYFDDVEMDQIVSRLKFDSSFE